MKKEVLKKMMEMAHKIARTQLEGDYQVRLKMALKMVWEAYKDRTAVVSYREMKRKEWQKYGKHRFYIDGEVTFLLYKAGMFSLLKTQLGGYIDAQTGQFHIATYGGTWAVDAQLKAKKYVA